MIIGGWGVALAQYAQKGYSMTEGTAVASTIHGSPLTAQDSWWDAEADDVEGYDLVKDKALFSLVGVPFRISSFAFRVGIQHKGIDWRNDFVSAELRVAPTPIIVRQYNRIMSRRTGDLIPDASAIPDPGEQLVINDGSTGLYRQVVQYLEAKDLIVVPDDLPTTGGKNECRYDLPASMFEVTDAALATDVAMIRFSPSGEQVTFFHVDLRCSRGLRYSDYDSELAAPGERALTWYIA
jgi:hypothetical protein